MGPSPLKETLAAALVQLSYWNRARPLADPFCGTGTIPIEAALLGRNMAPGAGRTFACRRLARRSRSDSGTKRGTEARDAALRGGTLSIIGSDIDETSLSMARRHARNAAVEADIRFERRPFWDGVPLGDYGCLICNPPYGERSGDVADAEELARQAVTVFQRFDTWSLYVLSALANFERLCQRQADRRRKLYNGRIACTYYQFHGPRPQLPAKNQPVRPARTLPALFLEARMTLTHPSTNRRTVSRNSGPDNIDYFSALPWGLLLGLLCRSLPKTQPAFSCQSPTKRITNGTSLKSARRGSCPERPSRSSAKSRSPRRRGSPCSTSTER